MEGFDSQTWWKSPAATFLQQRTLRHEQQHEKHHQQHEKHLQRSQASEIALF